MSDSFVTPVDCSPPGSPVHGISQARMLEWTEASFPSPGHLPDRGIKPKSPELATGFFTTDKRSPYLHVHMSKIKRTFRQKVTASRDHTSHLHTLNSQDLPSKWGIKETAASLMPAWWWYRLTIASHPSLCQGPLHQSKPDHYLSSQESCRCSRAISPTFLLCSFHDKFFPSHWSPHRCHLIGKLCLPGILGLTAMSPSIWLLRSQMTLHVLKTLVWQSPFLHVLYHPLIPGWPLKIIRSIWSLQILFAHPVSIRDEEPCFISVSLSRLFPSAYIYTHSYRHTDPFSC